MGFLGQEEHLRELQERFRFVHVVLFIFMGALLARLIYLQILQGDTMRKYSEENRIKRVQVAAPRGMIFDRDRKLLVDNRPAFDLEITPQYLKESGNRDEVIKRLADTLDYTPEKIEGLLKKNRNQPSFLPVKIKTDLSRDEVAKIESWKIDMPGVAVQTEIRRTSLYGGVGSHLLGYIGKLNKSELPKYRNKDQGYTLGDSIGKVGVERQLESVLRGVDGQEIVEIDALGRRVREQKAGRIASKLKGRPVVPGKNIVLTIDQDIQLAARKAFGDKVGGLVAIDVRTGEIISMISVPSFDSTEFSRGISPQLWSDLINNEDRPLRDKTLQDHYSPGSVFKAVTAIAALEEGLIKPSTRIRCPGKIRVGRRTYHCWKAGGHGEVDLTTAIAQSCNVYFYRTAQKFQSVDQIAKWATLFGFGEKTGIQLSREVPGLIPTESWKEKRFGKPWNAGESLSVAIGQSFVLTTILQLANGYATLANGGTLRKPYFIRSIEDAEGNVIESFEPEVVTEIDVNPKTIETVKKGLWKVVNWQRGTGYYRRIPGVELAGKTGTIQNMRVSADKIYQKCDTLPYRERRHGAFAGFAPVDNPVIAVAALAEHACSGSSGAMPIVRDVIKAYLMKYYPEKYSEEVLAKAQAEEWKKIRAKQLREGASPGSPTTPQSNPPTNESESEEEQG